MKIKHSEGEVEAVVLPPLSRECIKFGSPIRYNEAQFSCTVEGNPEIKVGDPFRMQTDGIWHEGKIETVDIQSGNYVVKAGLWLGL